HVIHEHGTKIQRRATLLNILSQAALIGVMVGVDNEPANTQDPYGIRNSPSRKGSLVQGTAATGIVFTELLLRDYSRGFEYEADIEGQRLAAAAGYDPDGARALWQLMLDRIPTSEDYGYWRTHPFSDQRLRAAEVRARDLKIQESPKSSEAYRTAAQAVILDFRENLEADETPEEAEKRRQERQRRSPEARLERDETPDWQKDLGTFLELSALEAWPSGETAEELRLARLHRLRDREMDRREVARDYGALAEAYEQQIEEVRRLTPKSTFLATLEKELGDLRTGADQVFPKAVEIWSSGIYQTPFLETFLSNFPAADQVPEVALALGNAYSRVRREADAVTYFLRAREAGPETEAGGRALAGLRNLTPVLEELVALQQLADAEDPELAGLAAKRLKEMAGRFETLQNGAEFLTAYPESPHGLAVKDRLEKLAQNLYGEVVLYQELGDSVKALERIQKILEFAPATTAAEALREKAVLVDA
ncbi:MAG: M48 family metalloprotease, partial [Acidobacteriota bacterium]